MGHYRIFNLARKESHGLPMAAFRWLLTGLGVAALVSLARLDINDSMGTAMAPDSSKRVEVESDLRADREQNDSLNGNVSALPAPSDILAPLTGEMVVTPEAREFQTVTLTVGRGDTLVEMIVSAGIRRREALDAISAMAGLFEPRRIQVGQDIQLELQSDRTPTLSRMVIRTGFDSEVVTRWTDENGYQSSLSPVETITLSMYREGIITDSLYMSAQRQGIPNVIIVELIRIFSFDVDFQREIRKDDQFAVYYQRRMTPDGREIENNEIIYARLVLRGKPLEFYRYNLVAEGRADYFAPSGQSARRTLMKTPVDGARISGTFGMRRHPILGYNRQHKGVDFAVPRGTPIMAAGDGIIERASRWGSYGNYVRIRHNDTYKTAYGHLNGYAKGIRAGRRVLQGEIIGYVGSTGGATGAHLHYEVLMDDDQVNPMTLNMPTGRKLDGDILQSFEIVQADVDSEIIAVTTFAAISKMENPTQMQAAAATSR